MESVTQRTYHDVRAAMMVEMEDYRTVLDTKMQWQSSVSSATRHLDTCSWHEIIEHDSTGQALHADCESLRKKRTTLAASIEELQGLISNEQRELRTLELEYKAVQQLQKELLRNEREHHSHANKDQKTKEPMEAGDEALENFDSVGIEREVSEVDDALFTARVERQALERRLRQARERAEIQRQHRTLVRRLQRPQMSTKERSGRRLPSPPKMALCPLQQQTRGPRAAQEVSIPQPLFSSDSFSTEVSSGRRRAASASMGRRALEAERVHQKAQALQYEMRFSAPGEYLKAVKLQTEALHNSEEAAKELYRILEWHRRRLHDFEEVE